MTPKRLHAIDRPHPRSKLAEPGMQVVFRALAGAGWLRMSTDSSHISSGLVAGPDASLRTTRISGLDLSPSPAGCPGDLDRPPRVLATILPMALRA